MSVPTERRREMAVEFNRVTEQHVTDVRRKLRETVENVTQMGLVDCEWSSWEIADTLYDSAELWVESIDHRLHEYTRGDQLQYTAEKLMFLKRRLAFEVSEWIFPHQPTVPAVPAATNPDMPKTPETLSPDPGASPARNQRRQKRSNEPDAHGNKRPRKV